MRIFQDDGRGSTAFLGEDWGKFTPLDDEMRLYVGVAQDIVVQRTIEKNELHRVAGNLYDIEVIVKYEIENFKDQAVTLDVAESLRDIRTAVYRDTGRDVQWELGNETTFEGGEDLDKSTWDKKAVSRPTAGSRCRFQGHQDRAQAALHHQERMVTMAAPAGPLLFAARTHSQTTTSFRKAHDHEIPADDERPSPCSCSRSPPNLPAPRTSTSPPYPIGTACS